MKIITLALTAPLLLATPALADSAAQPPILSRSIVNDGYTKSHQYCDQAGRCWTEGHRNPLLATYATLGAPPWYRKPIVLAKAGAKLRNAQAKMR